MSDEEHGLSCVLVVDDEESLRHLLVLALDGFGIKVETAADGMEGLERYQPERHQVVLTDMRMPRLDGLGFTRRLLKKDPEAIVVVMSAYGDLSLALQALDVGAVDYLNKPFQPDELQLRLTVALERWRLSSENKRLRRLVEKKTGFDSVVAASEAMREIRNHLERAAPHRSSVLFLGESGTGKEVLARAVHEASDRAPNPFVPVNCGAISEHLLESEFFGHVKGAFTDANRDRKGLFDEADGGTLFLDEVGELPMALQVKLLRALEEGKIRPVGASLEHSVDIRVLCATNRDLMAMVADGTFRQDLLYRLNVFTIEIPPLRERLEDLELLVASQLGELALASKRRSLRLSDEVWELFRTHPWPGNIRQMQNVLEAAAVICPGDVVELEHVPPMFVREATGAALVDEIGLGSVDGIGLSVPLAIQRIEKVFIERALARTSGNKTKAAKILEISPRALHYKIRDYDIS